MSYFPNLIIFSVSILVLQINSCSSESNYIETRESDNSFDNEYYDEYRTENTKRSESEHTEFPRAVQFTKPTTKFDNNALKKHIISWFKVQDISIFQDSPYAAPKYEYTIKKKRFANSSQGNKMRAFMNMSSVHILDRLSCMSCKFNEPDFDFSTKVSMSSCLTGKNLPTMKCKLNELCFVEVHPKRAVRGCIDPRNANRTFVCKCSMCNDKPYNETSIYKKEKDWRYDNAQIQQTFLEDMTLCKVCETEGLNQTLDNICRDGAKAENVICAANEICATTIIEANKYVWRGCVKKPIFNSFWFFCSTNQCNDQEIVRGPSVSGKLLRLLKTGTPEEIKMFLHRNGSIRRIKQDGGFKIIVILTIIMKFML